MRIGMMPVTETYRFYGQPRSLSGERPEGLKPLTLASAVAIDRQVRGVERAIDHEEWLSLHGCRGWQIVRGGQPRAYLYESDDGLIGPACWLDAGQGAPLLRFAFGQPAAGSELRVATTGLNHEAIRACLDAGRRLRAQGHFMATTPMPGLDRYVPSGTLLF